MTLLVGRAIEEDQDFWNQGLFEEGGDSDEDFDSEAESVSAGKDSFDSDFESEADEDEYKDKPTKLRRDGDSKGGGNDKI